MNIEDVSTCADIVMEVQAVLNTWLENRKDLPDGVICHSQFGGRTRAFMYRESKNLLGGLYMLDNMLENLTFWGSPYYTIQYLQRDEFWIADDSGFSKKGNKIPDFSTYTEEVIFQNSLIQDPRVQRIEMLLSKLKGIYTGEGFTLRARYISDVLHLGTGIELSTALEKENFVFRYLTGEECTAIQK